MENGYEKNYQMLAVNLKSCDFQEAAKRLGLKEPVNDEITLDYMDRGYKINKDGIYALDGQPSDPNDRSILVHYVTSKGSGEPEYVYYLLYHFGQSIFSSDERFLNTRSIQERAGEVSVVKKAMAILKAEYLGEIRSREHVWHYPILPKMPIELIYYEADDEFPCDLRIKLDGSAGRFMGFETLAFLCGSFIQGLLKICDCLSNESK